LLLAAGLLATGFGVANADVRTVRVHEAVEAALSNQLDILQAEKDVAVAAAQLNEAWANLVLPSVSGSGSFSYVDPNSLLNSYEEVHAGNNTYIITNAWADNYSAGISVSKTLFSGFKLWNAKTLQEWNLAYYRRKLQDEVQSVRTNVEIAFYSVLLDKKTVEDLALQAKDLQDHVGLNFESMKKGLSNEIDYLKAKVAYETFVPSLTLSVNNLSNAIKTLSGLCGYDLYAPVEYLGDLSELTDVSIAVGPVEELRKIAISNDITLASIDFNLRSDRINLDTTMNSRLPSLSANWGYNFGYRKNNQTLNERTWQGNWSAGLSLSVPMEEWLPFSDTAGSIDEQNQTIKKLEFSRIERVEAVMLNFDLQYSQLEQLHEVMEAQADNFLLARKELELEQAQNLQSIVTALDVEDAQVTLRTAEIAYWQSVLNYASAVWNFQYIAGSEGGSK
jgi:outer membrane protein TolC